MDVKKKGILWQPISINTNSIWCSLLQKKEADRPKQEVVQEEEEVVHEDNEWGWHPTHSTFLIHKT